MDIIYQILAGGLVGFIIGLTGVGGGALMTPCLIFLFKVNPAIAIGTDLLYAAFTKAGGVFVHKKNNNIDWTVVKYLSFGSIPSSLITIFALSFFDDASVYEGVMKSALGVMLVLTSTVVLFKDALKQFLRNHINIGFSVSASKNAYRLTFVSGVVLGILVTISSVGAGAIGAAVLMLLHRRLSAVQVVGTDLAHAVPLTLVAGMGHLTLGHIDYTLLFTLLCGSLPGIYVGSHLGSRLPDKLMRTSLASLLPLLGLRMAI